jgi:ABC-type branched-subunit amino acid transport system substrate-binding protein
LLLMNRRYRIMFVAWLVFGAALATGACGGSGNGQTSATGAGSSGEATTTTLPPSKDPIKIVFDGELTGPLVYDAALVKKGIRTALQMLDYRLAEWSIEYSEFDNKSDPLLAVEQTRGLVQIDVNADGKIDAAEEARAITEVIDFMCGPLSSSVAAGVTYFLSQRAEKRERIPQCSVTAQPKENITTSGDIGFIPNGIYSSYGYYLGKYAAETMQYKTANCIHYTDRIAEEIQSGFETGFIAAGGTITSLTYVPSGTVDFASYFAAMQPADCTMFWVRGEGAINFVRQYAASGLTGALLVPQSSNYSDSQLSYLDGLGIGRDMLACDIYTSELETTKNHEFIAAYQALYPGEYPTPEGFGGWQAVMIYAEAVLTLSAQKQAGVTERGAGLSTTSEALVDPRNPADVIGTMAKLTVDTPAGSITMSEYGKTYIATRDFYILRSRDVGAGRMAWAPIYTYSQVRLGQ